MTIKEYARHINRLAKRHPNFEIVSSSDDEGNSFSRVIFAPSIGMFTEGDNSFYTTDEAEWLLQAKGKRLVENAICIN